MNDSLIAVDANRYAVRAVLTDPRDAVQAAVEARTGELDGIVHFVRRHLEKVPLCIVGSPLDAWPEVLYRDLEQVTPIRWLSPDLMRGTASYAAGWQKERRLQRARFLAHLARRSCNGYWLSPLECVLDWEDFLVDESRNKLLAERQRTGYFKHEGGW